MRLAGARNHVGDEALPATQTPPPFQQEPGQALASVEHGPVLGDFRAAESVAERARSGQDGVSTEAMRVAVQQYRTVLYDLIGVAEPDTRDATERTRQEVQA